MKCLRRRIPQFNWRKPWATKSKGSGDHDLTYKADISDTLKRQTVPALTLSSTLAK